MFENSYDFERMIVEEPLYLRVLILPHFSFGFIHPVVLGGFASGHTGPDVGFPPPVMVSIYAKSWTYHKLDAS